VKITKHIKGQLPDIKERSHAEGTVTYLKTQGDFDEQVMRSVVGRGALAEIGSTKDLIDEFRGPVELP
jgi:hypothetical protein